MSTVELLAKIAQDSKFDLSKLSEKEEQQIRNTIQQAQYFNAVMNIGLPFEDRA